MKGYIITTVKNTSDWVVYDNDISIDYKEFLNCQPFDDKNLPLYYYARKKSYLSKIKSAIILYSSGPMLVNEKLKDILEKATKDVQFFDIELYCEEEKVEGFYALNLYYKVPCVDLEKSEYRLCNFDPNNPDYMFYYMELEKNILTSHEIFRCKENPRSIVVSERIKNILFNANLKGLQFSDSFDITPKNRTVYEKI